MLPQLPNAYSHTHMYLEPEPVKLQKNHC